MGDLPIQSLHCVPIETCEFMSAHCYACKFSHKAYFEHMAWFRVPCKCSMDQENGLHHGPRWLGGDDLPTWVSRTDMLTPGAPWGVCFLEDGTATFRGGIARLRKHERYLFAANWCKLMKRWQKLIWKRSWLSLLRIPLCAASAVNWIHVTLVFWMHPPTGLHHRHTGIPHKRHQNERETDRTGGT